MASSTLDMAMRLSWIDRATRPFRKAMGMIQRNSMRLAVLGTGAAVAGSQMAAMGGQMNAALQAPLQTAIQFESSMADVRKVVDFETPQQFAAMAGDIQRLSTEVPLAAEELAQIVAAAGQAGIAREELLRFTKDSAMMATAFDISAAEAGGAMTGLRAIFSLNQDGVVQLADTYNHLSNAMDATAGDLLNIANRAGSSAKLIGLSGQEVGALGAAMLALKTPPEVAATGINALLMRLATADKQGNKFQGALERMGMSASGLKAALAEDGQGAILDFLRTVQQSDDVVGNLSDLFGAEYADDIAKLVGSLDTYEQAVRLAGDQTGAAGSMFREYEQRSATTQNQLQLLNNTWSAFKNVAGSAVLPVLNDLLKAVAPLIQSFVDFAQANPTLFKYLMITALAFGALFVVAAKMLTLFGGLASAAGFLGPGLLKIAPALGMLRTGLFAAATAARAFGMALLANPVGLIIAGIVAIGLAIYMLWKHWDQVIVWIGGAWDWVLAQITAVWERIKLAFSGGVMGVMQLLAQFSPAALIMRGLNAITETLFGFNLYDAGAKIVGSLMDGLRAMASKPAELMRGIVSRVRNLLPFSPAKEGPLADIHRLKLIETIAGAIKPQPMVNAMRAAGVAGMAALTGATGVAAKPVIQPDLAAKAAAAGPATSAGDTAGAAGGGGAKVEVNVTYQINGGASDDLLAQLRARDGELAALIEEVMSRQQRKRF